MKQTSTIERVRPWVSVDEYLELEEKAVTRSEYFQGEIFAMAGGTPEHSQIGANTTRELGNLLEDGPCRVYNSVCRVSVPEADYYTYPDASVVCEEPRFTEQGRALLNPILLVEVLSESTEQYDHKPPGNAPAPALEPLRWVLVTPRRA